MSGLLIWWLIGRVDLAPVLAGLSHVSPLPVVGASAALFAAALFLAVRWNAINRLLLIILSRVRALRLTFIGLFFSQTLPSTIGGDVARVWFVYRDGVPVDRATSGVILDRLCALAALLAIVALSLPASFELIGDPVARLSLPALVAFGIGGFAVLFALGGRWGAILDRWKVTRFVAVVARDARLVFAPRDGFVAIFASALAIHLLTVLAVWLLAQSVAADIPFLHCLIFVPPVVLISMIPISIAGWGLREGAMVVAFGFVGVPEADALVVSVLFGLTLIVVGLPGGLLWLSEGRDARRGFSVAGNNES